MLQQLSCGTLTGDESHLELQCRWWDGRPHCSDALLVSADPTIQPGTFICGGLKNSGHLCPQDCRLLLQAAHFAVNGVQLHGIVDPQPAERINT